MAPMFIRWTILVFMLLFGLAADAAEPVFPPGSRIGLVPPVGMIVSQLFQGFEDREKNASVIFVELSSEAYPEIEKSFAVETLKAQGIDVQAREEFPLKDGHGFLVIAHPAAALRVSLATFTTRAAVPVQEQLDLLPFSLKDLAGFRIVRAAASGAALLTDGPKDAIELEDQPLLLITFLPGAGDQVSDRDSMARRAISGTPGVKEMRIVRSEAMRIAGQPGHEIVVDAKEAKTETELRVVQWLRFGTGGSLRVLGVVRKDQWDQVFPRFRAVRDAIEPK